MSLVRLLAFLAVSLQISHAKNYIRGCYYTNWAQYRPDQGKYLPENYVPGLCTHMFYAFAVMNPDFTMKPFEWNDESTDWSKGMYERVVNLKKLQPDLKISLSFGGWTFSQSNLGLMSQLFASSDNRKRFIDSVISFVRKHHFDGFDFDFEFPSEADKPNFVVLIQELKAAFEDECVRVGKPRLLLTAAVAAGFDKLDAGYDVPALARSLDFINVMTYDFHGAWEQVTGINSPLYDRNGDRYAIKDAAEYWANKGAPKHKINIGFAAYGRGWTLRNAGDTQVGAATSGPAMALPYTREGGIASYYEICKLLEAGAKTFYDDSQKGPYLVNGNQWFSYDDLSSFKTKLDWLKENGFGGAFVWALDMDDFTGGLCQSSKQQKFPLHSLIANELGGGSFTIPTAPTGQKTPHKKSTAATSTTSGSASSPTTTQPVAIFRCTGPGIFPDPNSCKNFYMCDAAGTAYLKTCPANLLFNAVTSVCDWPQNVTCTLQN